MGIDVFFTGLILICLNGESNCPAGPYGNTAWVVKADGTEKNPKEVCGRQSKEETELELSFFKKDFDYNVVATTTVSCMPGETKEPRVKCTFPHIGKPELAEICVLPFPYAPLGGQKRDSSLELVPRLGEIDKRFRYLDKHLLEGLPMRINFPYGLIGAGSAWQGDGRPPSWYRSNKDNSGALPRKLSDRLKATYEIASTLILTDCGKAPLLLLQKKKIGAERTASVKGKAAVTFQNRAKEKLAANVRGGYDHLDYLLWYYRLGIWSTRNGKCPSYSPGTPDKREAVLLSCKRKDDKSCAVYDGDTAHWPGMRGH